MEGGDTVNAEQATASEPQAASPEPQAEGAEGASSAETKPAEEATAAPEKQPSASDVPVDAKNEPPAGEPAAAEPAPADAQTAQEAMPAEGVSSEAQQQSESADPNAAGEKRASASSATAKAPGDVTEPPAQAQGETVAAEQPTTTPEGAPTEAPMEKRLSGEKEKRPSASGEPTTPEEKQPTTEETPVAGEEKAPPAEEKPGGTEEKRPSITGEEKRTSATVDQTATASEAPKRSSISSAGAKRTSDPNAKRVSISEKPAEKIEPQGVTQEPVLPPIQQFTDEEAPFGITTKAEVDMSYFGAMQMSPDDMVYMKKMAEEMGEGYQMKMTASATGAPPPSEVDTYFKWQARRPPGKTAAKTRMRTPDFGQKKSIGSPLSARTVYEMEAYDYMQFLIEPFERIIVPSVSTVSSSYVSCEEPELQRTIAIVKPDAMIYRDVILRAIFEAGFQIVGTRVLHLTPEQVSELYAKHYGSPSFPHLVMSVSVGPVLVLSLSALNVIQKWKDMIGPDGTLREDWFYPLSMRSRFGLRQSMHHVIHGSENLKESNRENRYFYPDSILEPLLGEIVKVTDYCGLYINPTLLNGLTEVVKKQPIDPILFLAEWLLLNNPFQPRFPYRIALTPT